MEIRCPNCATSYQVTPAALGPAGRSVRCARCQKVWFAANTAALSAIADSHRAEVTAFAAATKLEDLAEDRLVATATADQAAPEPPAAAEPLPEPAAPFAEPAEALPGPAAEPAEPAAERAEPAAELPPQLAEAPPLAPEAPEQQPVEGGEVMATDEVAATVEAPATAPIEIVGAQPAPAPETNVPEDIESLAARRFPSKRKRRRAQNSLDSLLATIVVLAIALGALLGWRFDVVRWAPQTASLYAAIGLAVNLRGLDFTEVTTVKETLEGVPLLAVEGTIANVSTRVVGVPRLRFAVRSQNGHEIYAWTAMPTKSVLVPGDKLEFRSRLASPPPEAHDVLVRFYNWRDRAAAVE